MHVQIIGRKQLISYSNQHQQKNPIWTSAQTPRRQDIKKSPDICSFDHKFTYFWKVSTDFTNFVVFAIRCAERQMLTHIIQFVAGRNQNMKTIEYLKECRTVQEICIEFIMSSFLFHCKGQHSTHTHTQVTTVSARSWDMHIYVDKDREIESPNHPHVEFHLKFVIHLNFQLVQKQ